MSNWYIEREDGEKIAGPFTTDVDASYARYWVERVLAPETFWIRREKPPRSKHVCGLQGFGLGDSCEACDATYYQIHKDDPKEWGNG